MKFTNKPNDFHEKKVLSKRIVPDLVGFKSVEDILQNGEGLRNKVNDLNEDINSNIR